MIRTSLAALLFFAGAGTAAAWGGNTLKVGDRAPAWTLPNMKGKKISSTSYEGKPAVLVVGTAREAAPPCREWMLTLHKNFKGSDAMVYQVIVLNNPWYIPEFAVINELEGFIPDYGQPLVMLEWETAWGELYGIPYDLKSRVIVIDRQGVIRKWYVGEMTDEALIEVLELVASLE